MFRSILVHGLIAGLMAGIPMSVMVMAMSGQTMMDWGMVLGYLTMLIALSAVFVAIKRRRDQDLGGVIRFWPAFGLGVGISVVAGVIYVVAWELAQTLTQMDFASDYAKAMIEQQRAKGVSPEALAKLTAQMEAFKVQYADPLFRLPMTFAEIFPVGLLVSLVSAGLLRNPRFLPARG
ncbi:MAG TPA: DUF4199 domain-containing protein [Ideonella sp.]|uniref:DUF4199 domain-containing protein n=1 Tax=Ideonella sp. TaxID=1929293 RepID=UPI002E32F5F1|nr:DUF4199 domain-containing protein [Ideonella sp.]HEX5684590.1 DUF4199 domain-containing protein [Ideonella sp.]